MNDSELLRQYAESRSDQAFAELVGRYVDLVYAAARRQGADAATADEITQGVFIVLARKAHKVNASGLPGWLLTATRYAMSDARKRTARRRLHEQRAASMTTTSYQPSNGFDEPVGRMLDEGMARLNTDDRNAVAMRYLQGKSLRDVGDALGVSEAAAHKRVSRAVARLRNFFSRRGIVLEASVMSAELARQAAAYHAPAFLASKVAAGAVSAAAVGTIGSSAIAEGILRTLTWIQIKLLASATAAALVLGGIAIIVVSARQHAATAPSQAASAMTTYSARVLIPAPIILHANEIWMPYIPNDSPAAQVTTFANDSLNPDFKDGSGYFAGLDETVTRGGKAVATVRSTTSNPIGATIGRAIPADPYRGKRVRFSAFLKGKDIDRAGVLSMQIYCGEDNLYAHDEIDGHELIGTHDWERFDIVSDVPLDATTIRLRTILIGKGTIWSDGYELAVVGEDVPTHDDHGWRSSGIAPKKFATKLDRAVLHEGRPTIHIQSQTAQPGEWTAYASTNHDAEEYLGKRVRLSVTMKCGRQGTTGGPFLRAVGPHDTALKVPGQLQRTLTHANTDWETFSTEMNLPPEALGLCIGVNMFAAGELWFDDLRLEVVGDR